MSDDLVTWLRAALDDDERVARAAEGLRKPYYFDFIDDAARPFVELAVDPARILAEVDAKRRILDGCEETLAGEDAWDPQLDGGNREPYELARFVLRLMALPYAARPGYRDEWKP